MNSPDWAEVKASARFDKNILMAGFEFMTAFLVVRWKLEPDSETSKLNNIGSIF